MSAEHESLAASPDAVARAPDGRLALWVCSRCGYVYDGNTGEFRTGTPPGVPFESLPAAWICPQCGAEKEHFFH